MIGEHTNWGFDAAAPAGIPDGVGDRYYAQDLMRDLQYILDRAGLSFKSIYKQIPICVEGGAVVQGVGATLNVTAGHGYAEYGFQTVLSYAADPPTTQTENGTVRVDWTAQTNLALPSYTPAGPVNYVKVKYVDADGSTRNRAKKAGSWAYEQTPSFVFEVDTSVPGTDDLCLCTFTEAAGVFTFSSYDAHRSHGLSDQVVVRSQADYDALWYRNAANQYYMHDYIKTVHFNYLSGGYDALTNILSGGDTWGEIFTNNCVRMTMDRGTFIQFKTGANEVQGSLQVDTDYCTVKDIHIKGTGSTAAGVTECFELAADHVIFENCIASNRLSNVAFTGFRGSGTASHNQTSRFINCTAFTLDTTGAVDTHGFLDTDNVHGAVVYDIDGANDVYGMKDCEHISNCRVEDIDSSGGSSYGYSGITLGVSLYAFDIQSASTFDVFGYSSCSELTSCVVKQIDASGAGAEAYGYYFCYQIGGCRAEDIDSVDNYSQGFDNCRQLSGCRAYFIHSENYRASGFNSCSVLSACVAEQVTSNHSEAGSPVATGFLICNYMSGCLCFSITSTNAGSAQGAYGFYICKNLAGCRASACTSSGGTNRGISGSDYISAFNDNVGNPTGNGFQDDVGLLYSCDNI